MYISLKNNCILKDFDETKYISFLKKDDELLEKNTMNLEKKIRIVSKKNLIVSQYTMTNI